MNDTVIFDHQTYNLKYKKTQGKNLTLYVEEKNKTMTVCGKREFTQTEVEDLLHKKADKLKKIIATQRQSLERDGHFLLLGKTYKVVFEDRDGLYEIKGDVIYIQDFMYPEIGKKLVRSKCLKQVLDACIIKYKDALAEYGIPIIPYTIKQVKSYFGINRVKVIGNTRYEEIFFSEKMGKLPVKLIEHVFLHEHCHHLYRNHQQEFYTLLSKLDPETRNHKRQLKNIHLSNY